MDLPSSSSPPPAAAATKKTPKKKKTKKKIAMHHLCIRSRVRALCRVMELRTSVVRYYMEESQYMDRVRSRVALSLGAFDESDEWKYGRKVLNSVETFLPKQGEKTSEELRSDLDLLRDLEAQLEKGTSRPDTDIPDDDLNELSDCLREEIDLLRDKVMQMRQSVSSLQQRVNPTPPPPPPQTANAH